MTRVKHVFWGWTLVTLSWNGVSLGAVRTGDRQDQMLIYCYRWATPCENVSLGKSLQAVWFLFSLSTNNQWIQQNVSVVRKCLDETWSMNRMNFTLCILHIFKNTFGPGPSCWKLMMSLVNTSLKLWSLNKAYTVKSALTTTWNKWPPALSDQYKILH